MNTSKDKPEASAKPATLPLLLGLAAFAVLLATGLFGGRNEAPIAPATTASSGSTSATTTAPATTGTGTASTTTTTTSSSGTSGSSATTTTDSTTTAAVTATAPIPADAPKPTVPLADLMASTALADNVLGQPNAPVTIVEYASMTCPHCARFHGDVLPELKKKYIDTGKAKLVFREFPLDNLAVAVSMLARCSGPMRYFAFIEGMYKKQDEWTDFPEAEGPLPKLKAMTKEAGFTDQSVESCLADQKLLDGLNEISTRAKEKFSVRSTPTVFVNGVKLEEGLGIEEFDKLMKAFGQG